MFAVWEKTEARRLTKCLKEELGSSTEGTIVRRTIGSQSSVVTSLLMEIAVVER